MDIGKIRTAKAATVQAHEALERSFERDDSPPGYALMVSDLQKALAEIDRAITALGAAHQKVAGLRRRWERLVAATNTYPGPRDRLPKERPQVSKLFWSVSLAVERCWERQAENTRAKSGLVPVHRIKSGIPPQGVGYVLH